MSQWIRSGAYAALAAVWLAGCATARQDVTGSGDDRLDEAQATDADNKTALGHASSGECGTGPGNLVLIDARNGNPISCASFTLSRDVEDCQPSPGNECPTEVVLQGRTNARGEVMLPDPALANVRLWAVAEGFQASNRDPAPIPEGKVGELEMLPEDGFLLKFVDVEGNYLPNLTVSFKQGGEVIAQLRTNELANVYFTERTPFAGEPVTIEAEGFAAVTINGPQDLGSDGNTVTLHR
ncbi:MAG: hypothetical protein IRZ16_21135 [Myxococcaceae bacterium]|nr:hypothetical protein [Myxococcaceae bacterium]